MNEQTKKQIKESILSAIVISIFGFSLAGAIIADKYEMMSDKTNQGIIKTDVFEKQKGSILWDGYSGQHFDVKVTSYDKEGEADITKEITLKNIIWGKLELWPTIGSIPTLRYIDALHPNEIKVISCSYAKIL